MGKSPKESLLPSAIAYSGKTSGSSIINFVELYPEKYFWIEVEFCPTKVSKLFTVLTATDVIELTPKIAVIVNKIIVTITKKDKKIPSVVAILNLIEKDEVF